MKKVKIMLVSLALFAVVGGALAFKAKYNRSYCTAPTLASGACPQFCPTLIINSTTTDKGDWVCTTTPIEGECPETIPCSTSTKLTID